MITRLPKTFAGHLGGWFTDYVKSLDDYLFDIDDRPSNGELRFWIGFQVALVGGAAYALPLFALHWVGVREWALVIIPLLCAGGAVWWLITTLRRRGVATKVIYRAHGGNPADTSDFLFGQVAYEITEDGRWKWPTPSSGE